ncbi:MAG: hypothetical protein M3333_01350 [Actinomycetota bacterium]|nr:hypothetical protein [Actinomycetota bacterium]
MTVLRLRVEPPPDLPSGAEGGAEPAEGGAEPAGGGEAWAEGVCAIVLTLT